MRQRGRELAALILVAVSGALSGCASAPPAPPTVAFLSDFGHTDDSVAICKGVMLGIDPGLRIVDITHDVPPFSILDGARFLAGAAPYYPAGTVFVAVVDPGVGSERRCLVARTRRGQYFVLPDNGLITLVADQDAIDQVRVIENPDFLLRPAPSSTFHGRDIFSPVAAHLAHGREWNGVGPVVERWVRLTITAPRLDAGGLTGEVIGLDGPYGNLVTNIDAATFARLGWSLRDRIPVRIGNRKLTLPYVRTFADVPEREGLIYIDSRERLGLAINLGSFAEIHGVRPPEPIRLEGPHPQAAAEKMTGRAHGREPLAMPGATSGS